MKSPKKAPGFHSRLKLEEFGVEKLPGGRCEGRVELAWNPDDRFVGTAEGEDSPAGRVQCAAEATAVALERATASALGLEPGSRESLGFAVRDVTGVRMVHEYDVTLVLVSMTIADVVTHIPGSCLNDHRPIRAAVLAVLRATNRYLSTVISP